MSKADVAPSNEESAPDELTAVAEASRLVGTGGSVPEALRLQLGVLHEVCRARTSFVALHDPSRGLLSVVASRGRADPRVRAQRLDEGILGRAFREQRAVELDDTGLALGFTRAGQPAGAIELVGHRNRPSDSALSALSASFGSALEVASLQDELNQRKGELEQLNAALKVVDLRRDEFLGRVSHELKTPLTTIKTYLALLLRQRMGELLPEQERAIAIADRNSDRLLRLIDDLLLVSRLTVGQMSLKDKPFGLKQLLEECWALSQKAAERAEVELVPVPGGELFVRGDREHLRESALALLDNAIRYNRPGGRVWGKLSSAGATARVEISDSGSGMSNAKLAALFEPFDPASAIWTRRKSPTSALARVRQVAELHGGAITAESIEGQGSTFALTLPLFAGMVAPADDHGVPSAQRGGVLVVEDDDDCREGVQELLEAEGIEVFAVARADEAIAALQTLRPALLLVDLRLREGDGRSVVSYVRATEALASIPVFVMSGAVSEAASLRTEGPDRIDGFFEKPLNLPRVLAAIRAIVQAERAE